MKKNSKLYKRSIIPVLSFFILISVGINFADAGIFIAAGPKEFIRGKGKPFVETFSFNIKNPDANYTLYIDNGSNDTKKVSSAIIKLNKVVIFDTSDFSKKVGQLSKVVSLSAANNLEVELRGQPGSGLSISIEGEDNSPPDIKISAPLDGIYINTPRITVEGSTSDSISWVENVSVNGNTAVLSGELFTYAGLTLLEGNNTITAAAIDVAGNSDSVSVKVTLDTIAPEINLNSIPALTNNPILSASGSISDSSPISSLTINGVTLTLTDNQFQKDLNLIEGINDIIIEAIDKAGNKATKTVQVLLDVTLPQITIENPQNGVFLNTPLITVSGSASDSLSGLLSVTVNDIEVTHAEGVYALENFQLTEGENVITAVATDKAGNVSRQIITITADFTPPQISILSPSNGVPVNNDVPQINIEYTDLLSGINVSTTAIKLNNIDITGEVTVTEGGMTYTPSSPLQEGSYTVTAYVADRAGNTANQSITFIVDKTQPVINAVNPLHEAIINNNIPGITLEYLDSLSGIEPSSIVFTLDGTDLTSAASVTETGVKYTIETALEDGAHTISLTVSDKAGNNSSINVNFTVDITPPVINSTLPENGATVNSTTPEISILYSDSLSGIDISSTILVLDGVNVTEGSSITITGINFIPTSPLEDGIHNIDLTIQDIAGNTFEHAIEFITQTRENPFIYPEPGFDAGHYDDLYKPNRFNFPLKVIDVNKDGNLDVIVANRLSDSWGVIKCRISVLLGTGDGGLKKYSDFANAGNHISSMEPGDFNGDSYPDLAVMRTSPNELYIYSGSGDGTFTETASYNVDAAGRLFTGRFNDDNHEDIIIAGSTKIAMFAGKGDGTFNEPLITETSSNYLIIIDSVVMDLNDDGIADIVYTSGASNGRGGEVVLMTGKGDGTFGTPVIVMTDGTNYLNEIYSGDINGDGKIDLIVTWIGSSTGFYPILGQGGGSFYPDNAVEVEMAYFSYGHYGRYLEDSRKFMRVRDINGDGNTDIIVRTWASDQKLNILMSMGDGTFKDAVSYNTNEIDVFDIADIDGNGTLDVVTSDNQNIHVLFGEKGGIYRDRERIPLKNGSYKLVSADFDGDNRPDIAISLASNRSGSIFSTLLNRGSDWTEDNFQSSYSEYDMESDATFIKSGDLNNDGFADVVIINDTRDSVSVLLNSNSGKLGQPVSYSTGTSPVFALLKDINGDKHLDIITINGGSGNISVLLGKGDGTFQDHKTYDAGSSPKGLAIGDFNSDGNYDIAVSDSAYSSSDIHILIGDGKGSFNTGKIFKMSVSQPGKIVAADFDEDGIIDLAVHSISSSSIWLLTGNGDATFTEMSLIYAPNDFIVNDFNRDGNLDIMSFKFGSRKALVYSGDGNKDFKLTHEFTYPMSYTPEKWLPIVKDLNDDGDLDLLINARDSLMTFHGQGDGTFQKGFSFGGYKSANGLEVSDFNHDGIVDIAIASEKRFSIIPGKGNGLFQGEALINIDGLHSGISMITGDFNNDHNQDIAFSAYPSEWYSTPKDTTKIFFYWGSGHNTFKSGPVIETSTNYGGRLYGSDFNGDGNTDIAYLEHGWSGNNVLVYLAKGDGIFSEAIPYEIEDHRSSIQLGDVNGDGYTDIINNAEINTTWGNSSYSVNIHAGNGDGTFHFHQAIPLGEYPWDRHLSSIPGDFNNDGYNDLVTRESNSLTDYYNMKIFLNKGDGTFGSIAVYEINLRRSGKLYVKDLDLDGNLDIALVSSVITHFRGNGDGTFNAGVDYARDASGLNVVFKDFNLDGLPDIASSSGHDARAYLDLIYHLKKPLANPLSPPKGLKGVVDDSSASLVWAENSEADLKGYNIYRSLSPGGGYEKLNATLVSSASYKDTGLTNGLTYYYTVSAVNNNDEESSFAVKVGVMPIPPDTEAPNFNIITPAESEPVITPYLFVSGTIDDPDAKISVNGIAGTIHKQDGVFTVYDIPLNIGENTLTVVAVDLMGNVSEKTAKVIYTPTAIVSGTVKSEDSGLAVSYAYVQIRDTEKTQYLWTGTDGRYRFNKIVPGEIYIKAHGSNYGTVNITRTVSPGEELLFDISLPLYPAAIRAWIYDSYNYSSIGNATVTIEDPKKTQTLTSNDSGYFETYNVAPFQATITISKDGYETYSKVHTLTNQWTNYLYFYLDTLPPSAPVGVAASDAMEGVIQLTWSANSEGNLVGYRIYRSLTAGSGYQFIGSTNASTISFTDSDVEIGTNYYYVVTANNSSSQESGNSVEVSASPKELPVPAGLSATPGEGEVKLAWSSSPGNGLSSYNIYRSELSATDYTLIDSVSSSYLSYTDVDVEAGITYYYVVTAVNAWSKESGWSNEASAIPEEVLLRVNITSPIEGSFLDSSHTIVTGTAKSISPEVGVIIIVEAQTERETLTRSYLAHFNDGDFAAEVNLFPAAFNTIKAIATIPSGETDESSKTVYAGGTINVATLDASPSSGIIYTSTGNLDIEFEVDYKGSGTPIAYSWDFNGDGVVDSVTSTPGPVTFGYSGAGIYTPEVTVTVENSTGGGLPGPFGRDEVQTVKVATVVNVMNLEQTDAILKAVWSGMKEAMKAGDVNSILTFYHPSSREKYKRVFIALADQLSGIAVNMNDIEMDYIRNDVAEYRFSRLEEFNSSLIEITYFIYFVKDEDGLWRIESF